MNILFINHNAGLFGGVEQNIAQVAAALRALGHNLYLAFYERTERDFDEFCSLFNESFQLSLEHALSAKEQLGEIISQHHIQIAYVHKVQRIEDILSHKDTCPAVAMIHDHDVYCPRKHRYTCFSNTICNEKMGLRCYLDLGFLKKDSSNLIGIGVQSIRAKQNELARYQELNRLLVGSRYMQEQLVKNGIPEEKISIAAPVVNASNAPYEPSETPNHILYVGQLIRGKGVDLLIEALANTKNHCSLTIVGKGNFESHLKSIVSNYSLEDRVHFAGWRSPNELSEMYRKASFVAVPSRWPEPFGMVGLEAMRHGRAVIAYDVGGISDWLQDGVNGYLVAQGSREALAEAIDRLVADPEQARQFGQKGRALAEELFGFKQYIQKLQSVFAEHATHTRQLSHNGKVWESTSQHMEIV